MTRFRRVRRVGKQSGHAGLAVMRFFRARKLLFKETGGDPDTNRTTGTPTDERGTTANQTERDRDGTGDTNHPTGRAPQATDGQLSRTDTQRVRTHTGRATHS